MNSNFKQKNDDNKIKEIAREIFSFDEESLLKEFEAAKQEADREREANPETCLKPDDGFEALMSRMREENIKPIYAADFEAKMDLGAELELELDPALETEPISEPVPVPVSEPVPMPTKRRPIRFKVLWRPLLAAAIIMSILFGGEVVALGRRGYNFWEAQVGKKSTKVIWSNIEDVVLIENLRDTYEQIEESLGIRPMKLKYFPLEMTYQALTIDKGEACLIFDYAGKPVYFYQVKYLADNSNTLNYDQVGYDSVYNQWLDMDITLSKNELNSKETEYRGELAIRDVTYCIYGIMDEDEMVKILKYWSF